MVIIKAKNILSDSPGFIHLWVICYLGINILAFKLLFYYCSRFFFLLLLFHKVYDKTFMMPTLINGQNKLLTTKKKETPYKSYNYKEFALVMP